MFGLSPVELLVIGGLAALLFGSRLPRLCQIYDINPRWLPNQLPVGRILFIAAVVIEGMLGIAVLYERFAR